jgi:hypothetical protein
MADPKRDSRPADYSSSQAPETQEAERREREHDDRAIPGGDPSRSNLMVGMESVDQDERTARLAGHPRARASQAPPAPHSE